MRKQVTVFGANGKVGSLVVLELLARGYAVVAFVHGDDPFVEHSLLKVFQGDIYDKQSVVMALRGSSVVVSALGSWGTPKKDILTIGMAHIIAGMNMYGIDRIVSLTGAEARAFGDKLSVVHRMMHFGLHVASPKVLSDGEKHIELLERSDVDWTVVRSPIMTSRLKTNYQLIDVRPLPWQTISRQSVVLAISDAVSDRIWSRQAPFIAKAK